MRVGLLFDLEYCVGCQTCCVACRQENDFDAEHCGIRIIEQVYDNPNGRVQVDFLPFVTELCTHCTERIASGFDYKPSCVKHCPTNCIEYGDIDELYEKAKTMKRPILYLSKGK